MKKIVNYTKIILLIRLINHVKEYIQCQVSVRPHPRLLYAGDDGEPESPTDSQVADRQAQYDEINRQQALEIEAIALDVEQQIRNTARQIAEQRAPVPEPAPIPPPPQVFPTTPQNSPPGSPVIGSPGFSSTQT